MGSDVNADHRTRTGRMAAPRQRNDRDRGCGPPHAERQLVATAIVDAASITAGARAGIAAFGNRDNLLAVTIERRQEPPAAETQTGTLAIEVWQTRRSERRTLATSHEPATGPDPSTALRDRQDTLRVRGESGWSHLEDPGGAEGGYLPPGTWACGSRSSSRARRSPRPGSARSGSNRRHNAR